MTLDSLEKLAVIFGSVATGVGVLTALIFGLIQARSAAKNQERSRRSNQMQALVAFDQMLENYHHIHTALRPGGRLVGKEDLSHQDIVDLERYMGLFERAKIFIDDGFLTDDHFKHLYGYRMYNLAKQPWIREKKLIAEAGGWRYFLQLYQILYPEDYQLIDNSRRT